MSRNVVNTQAGDGASFSVRSCRVSRVVTHTIAGRNCGDESVRELEREDAERRYVGDAEGPCVITPGLYPALRRPVRSGLREGGVRGSCRVGHQSLTPCLHAGSPNHSLYATFHLHSRHV